MKKIILLLLCSVSLNSFGQCDTIYNSVTENTVQEKPFVLERYKKTFEISFEAGGHRIIWPFDNDSFIEGYGISISAYGFYLDFICSTPKNGYPDCFLAYSVHGGIKFPITKYFTITPLIGYENVSYEDQRDKWEKIEKFDYGIKTEFIHNIFKENNSFPSCGLKFGVTLTKYATYANIGFVWYIK